MIPTPENSKIHPLTIVACLGLGLTGIIVSNNVTNIINLMKPNEQIVNRYEESETKYIQSSHTQYKNDNCDRTLRVITDTGSFDLYDFNCDGRVNQIKFKQEYANREPHNFRVFNEMNKDMRTGISLEEKL